MSAADVVVDEVVVETPDYLNMSDEELMAAPAPKFEAAPAAEKMEADEVVVEEVKVDKEDAADDADPEDAPAPGASEPAAEEVAKEDKADEVKEPKKVPEAKAPAKVEEKKVEVVKDEKVETPINFEAEYKKLLAPFKANGKEVSVETVEDAIDLMKMGANYNKKMAGLKPSLKILKMLENNGFLSEDKISFLIDLGKKDPAAINKLVKDSGIDPMDLSAEKASTYKQTAYAVDDREMELDTVLDDLKESATYTRTLDVVSNKWDVASKQVVSKSPQLLKVIDDHMASGIYDVISTAVEKERVFGRLKGLSDLEAYRQVGDSINARGGFDHLVQTKSKPTPAEPVVVTPKPKVEDDKLKDKRRAASSTQPAAPAGTPKEFNPLDMSDEEFSKLAVPKFK